MVKKSITTYEAEIRGLHQQITDYPDSKTLRNRLSARLGKWQPMLDITVVIANNERKPWNQLELGILIAPMHTKDITVIFKSATINSLSVGQSINGAAY